MPAPIVNQITICNSSLLKCGADVIQSINQPGRAALICNTLYAYLRDEVMGEYQWRFATKRATLAPTGTAPIYNYGYTFDIPDDCLRPLKVWPDSIEWVVESGQILTDSPTLDLQYIWRNTDESSWDARFAEALAWRLAMELALSLTKSIPMYQAMEKSYDKALSAARSTNAVIGTLPPLEADVWSGARKGRKEWRKSVGQTGDP